MVVVSHDQGRADTACWNQVGDKNDPAAAGQSDGLNVGVVAGDSVWKYRENRVASVACHNSIAAWAEFCPRSSWRSRSAGLRRGDFGSLHDVLRIRERGDGLVAG
jgi:hypothetical protein